jgi:hypothetical protein
MLHDGRKSVGKVCILAVALDAIYQVIVQRWVYPGGGLLVARIHAFMPYELARGPVNRVARRSKGPSAPAPASTTASDK